MKYNKGFTLIELLAVIVILAIIALISTPVIMKLIENAKKESFKSSSYGIIGGAEIGFAKTLLKSESAEATEYQYENGIETQIQGNIDLNYNGKTPNSGTVIINSNGKIAIAFYEDGYCAVKNYDDSEITLIEMTEEECVIGEELPDLILNAPVLATGMTPIVWDGDSWETVLSTDPNWYDYRTKKWANARTADGSMWVWIPRYIYRVSSGWHNSTTGTINVRFVNGIDDTINGNVSIVNTGSATDSNGTWTNHPAFTFGTVEVRGIWVAKFKATASEGVSVGYTDESGTCTNTNDNVTTKTIKVVPNVASWRCITNNNIFLNTRSMETNSVYGWGTSGNGIDTHMMKNTEWGAVSYLTHSPYGKKGEIWNNPSRDYITGCAGSGLDAAKVAGCPFTYDSSNGLQASNTGNIYGIYDMSDYQAEYVAAYVNNGSASLNTYGASLVSAEAKYKDVYSVTTDSPANNYTNAISHKGDAIYETTGNTQGYFGWNGDYVYTPSGGNCWFHRSGLGYSGMFYFGWSSGGRWSSNSFRPTLMVETGL